MSRLYAGWGSGVLNYFDEQYTCYSVETVGMSELEMGDKVVLPVDAIQTVSRLKLEFPLFFRIAGLRGMKQRRARAEAYVKANKGKRVPKPPPSLPNNGAQFCSVLEFSAAKGAMYAPRWMMENIGVKDGGKVHVMSTFSKQVPQGQFVKFQPHTKAFVEVLGNLGPKRFLESALARRYSVLSRGERIVVQHNGVSHPITVLACRPANAVSILGSVDLEVDFAPSKEAVANGEAVLDEDDDVGKGKSNNAKKSSNKNNRSAVPLSAKPEHLDSGVDDDMARAIAMSIAEQQRKEKRWEQQKRQKQGKKPADPIRKNESPQQPSVEDRRRAFRGGEDASLRESLADLGWATAPRSPVQYNYDDIPMQEVDDDGNIIDDNNDDDDGDLKVDSDGSDGQGSSAPIKPLSFSSADALAARPAERPWFSGKGHSLLSPQTENNHNNNNNNNNNSLLSSIIKTSSPRNRDNVEKARREQSEQRINPNPDTHGECNNCGRFVLRSNLAMHELHCARSFWKCTQCGDRVARADVAEHKRSHETTVCDCGIEMEVRLLEEHRNTECIRRMVVCEWCGGDVVFEDLDVHEEQCKNELVVCERCGDDVTRFEQRNDHIEHCSPACPECGERVLYTALQEHLDSQCLNRKDKCPFCHMMFPVRELQAHRDACGSRTDQCEVCSKWIRLADMEAHVASGCVFGLTRKDAKKKKRSDLVAGLANSSMSEQLQHQLDEIFHDHHEAERGRRNVNELVDTYTAIGASLADDAAKSKSKSKSKSKKKNDDDDEDKLLKAVIAGTKPSTAGPPSTREAFPCPHCHRTCLDFEDLQVHMLTACPMKTNGGADVSHATKHEPVPYQAPGAGRRSTNSARRRQAKKSAAADPVVRRRRATATAASTASRSGARPRGRRSNVSAASSSASTSASLRRRTGASKNNAIVVDDEDDELANMVRQQSHDSLRDLQRRVTSLNREAHRTDRLFERDVLSPAQQRQQQQQPRRKRRSSANTQPRRSSAMAAAGRASVRSGSANRRSGTSASEAVRVTAAARRQKLQQQQQVQERRRRERAAQRARDNELDSDLAELLRSHGVNPKRGSGRLPSVNSNKRGSRKGSASRRTGRRF